MVICHPGHILSLPSTFLEPQSLPSFSSLQWENQLGSGTSATVFELPGGFNGHSSQEVVFKKYSPSTLPGLAEEAANSTNVGVLIAQFSDGLVLERMPGDVLPNLFAYKEEYDNPSSLDGCLNFVKTMTALITAAVKQEFEKSGLMHS